MTETTTRRGFLAFAASTLASLPLIGGIFVALRTGLAPSRGERPDRFPLCRLDEVPDDDILVRAVSYQMRRGPKVEDVSQVVFVTRDPADPAQVIVLAGECTHLSCPVQKQSVQKQPVQKIATASADADADAAPLACPCHGGRFSRTGEVLDGPPPRPLRRLKHELPEDGAGMIWLAEV
ncbi:MAG: Rieske (2Fe-2S) protein [Planctomycetota bacterium]